MTADNTTPIVTPDETAQRAAAEFARLVAIMARLRAPDGCPWDQVQDFDSIAPYTLEEAHEVAEAIARRDWASLADELGDLLFQVVYHAQMASEENHFDVTAVTKAISDKMIRRHPHVFGSEAARTAEEQIAGWETVKAAERASRRESGTLAGVSAALPALTRAAKLTRRAARVGFDWPNAEGVLEKLAEETDELRAELPKADKARMADELGDMLFVLANLARKLDLDPEQCLTQANRKFERRFNAVEQNLAMQGLTAVEAGLDRMEQEWIEVKKAEKSAI
ncbi:nucleoside triphosphate pyrophosphohydrolase [Acetobacteraceae bacterium H6797]|nr:nucleoside triphosphate pyrophosphohydrolase [Acetobacteraceae bacterium H6797]